MRRMNVTGFFDVVRAYAPRLSRLTAFSAAVSAAALIALGAPGVAFGQSQPEKTGDYGDWSVYVGESNGSRQCYAATQPIEQRKSQEVKVRGRPFLIVSTFLSENVRDEVSVTLGFEADNNKTLEIAIDESVTYKLFSEGEHAFVNDAADNDPLVAALRRGGVAEVTSVSKSRGTVITDVYSLKGVTAALRSVSEVCQ